MVSDPLTLKDLARDPALRRLLDRARRRLEETGGAVEGTSVSLPDPTEDERRRVELLLGAVKRGRGLRVDLDRLDKALHESRLGTGLIKLLEVAGSRLRDRPGEREANRRTEAELWEGAATHPAVRRHPGLSVWLDGLRATGQLRRLAGNAPGELLNRALRVLHVLPATHTDRAVLAADLFGDAHALDASRPEAKLVLSALEHLAKANAKTDTPKPPRRSRASGRRALWESQGVLSDAVSSTVLLLRLAPRPKGPVTRGIAQISASGAIVPVTLEMLTAEQFEWPGIREVFISENPTVLGVASTRLNDRCPPMICVSGMPTLAARRLLDSLRRAKPEIPLHYHGDFGAGGIRIANVVIGEHGAQPWRFRTEDYERALTNCTAATPIRATIPEACWDPHLAPAMRKAKREIQEEQVLPDLLHDLTS